MTARGAVSHASNPGDAPSGAEVVSAAGGAELPGIAAPLVAWQRVHGRHGLPWQQPREPYRVWLSEVMLQQTQVSTVLGYFGRFLQRFPDVQALAAAPQDEVLALWSGLGYYSRARNLHRCAQQVVSQHGGRFPADAATLASLPGIGRSTAAAIAAFCHGQRVAILDGNVKRVLARVLAFDGDLAQPRAVQRLWELAERLLPADTADVPAYTQGLMDLGAAVCTARRPRCDACPLAAHCAARAAGEPERWPVKSRRAARGEQSHALLWLTHADRVWLVQRPETGIWAGLWSLPEWPDADSLLRLADAGPWPGEGEALPRFKHVLTHRDWWLQPVRWRLPARLSAPALAALEADLPRGRWWALDEALQLGLPAPVRRLLVA